MEHAYEQVALHRERFDEAGVTPNDFHGPSDLSKIPPLSRSTLAARNPQGRFIKPQEVADVVLWLCADGSASITGQAISVSGGETW